MRRSLISLFAIVAILLQGLATAWAAPMRIVAQQEQQEMPCHQSAQTQSATSHCCCDDSVCQQICASGSTAPPMQAAELDDYIAAHFDALRNTPSVFPEHALNRLRPPITPSS